MDMGPSGPPSGATDICNLCPTIPKQLECTGSFPLHYYTNSMEAIDHSTKGFLGGAFCSTAAPSTYHLLPPLSQPFQKYTSQIKVHKKKKLLTNVFIYWSKFEGI